MIRLSPYKSIETVVRIVYIEFGDTESYFDSIVLSTCEPFKGLKENQAPKSYYYSYIRILI